MPFIRHARDKRGYESTFVMHAYRGAHASPHPRVLYSFRSPSNVKVGRHPLDPEVMEALEHTHPDLTFDWPSLIRENSAPRMEGRDRDRDRHQRPSRPDQRPEPSRPRPPAEPVAAVIIEEDDSLLGRTVGVREAARLRERYEALLQRIARRARTPEERDRLTDRAHRLNPDEWVDPAAIQTAVTTVDAEWTAIAEELPHRRRGRRGGRSRGEGSGPRPAGAPGASGIINEQSPKGDWDEDATQELEPGPSGDDAGWAGRGDGIDVGADAAPESTQPAERAVDPAAGASAEAGPGDLPVQPSQETGQVFRATTDIIPIDVYPRDAKGQFIPDLKEADFQIFEDGVEQKLLNFTRANGGQFYNDFASAAPPAITEGLVLPKATPKPDTASRIFIIFIDDLHFMATQTPNVRKMLQLIRDTVIHENDLVGFVSSGHSSIEVDPTYDYQHRRFNEVIDKVVGSGPTIDDMIRMEPSQDGLSELNYNIGAAFQAAHNLLVQMEDLHGKRKAFIWISNGYSLDPFKDSRLMAEMQRYVDVGACDNLGNGDPNFDTATLDRMNPCRYAESDISEVQNVRVSETAYGMDIFGQSTMQWKNADLMSALAELIQSARRANTMFFTLDPRGLISGFNNAERSQALSNQETEFILGTVGTLRALAENTGGLACVNTNDCRPTLQQIDNMTSDYYMLGYRSSNPDPFKLARKIEIKVKRPNVVLVSGRDYRDTYYLKKQPRPPKAAVPAPNNKK